MDSSTLTALLALVGAVIVIAALLSGFIERASFPQVAVFLLLGLAIGPHGLGLLEVGLDSPILSVVATLSLALVLFTDAVTLDLSETKSHARLGAMILGPGTLLSALAIALLARFILGLGWAESSILAAALASTDPVMLRGFLRSKGLSAVVRQALRLESGLNDIVLLPIILIAMLAIARAGAEDVSVGGMALSLFVLGPGLGALVGGVAIGLLRVARQTIGVRRDYESFYSLGVSFGAYAATEAIHASGFLACFAAGIVIAALDKELCDCFVEYGETTAEMLLMFTFVLLGGSLIWEGLFAATPLVALFALAALAARPVSLLLTVPRVSMDRSARRLLVLMGPRGLSTLLLILVPVFALTPGAEQLFHVSTVCVLLSVVVHGAWIMAIGRHSTEQPGANLRHTPKRTPVDLLVTPGQLRERIEAGQPVQLLDARSSKAFAASELLLENAVRIAPHDPARSASEQKLAKDAWLALFCT